jgi:hypothetical protein
MVANNNKVERIRLRKEVKELKKANKDLVKSVGCLRLKVSPATVYRFMYDHRDEPVIFFV